MSNQKTLGEIVKLVIDDFSDDRDMIRLKRRFNMIKINLVRTGRLVDASNVGELKNVFLKRKGGVKQNGRR